MERSPKNHYWETMLSLFSKKDVFNEEVFHFENEVKTMKYFYGPEVIRNTFEQWLLGLEDQAQSSDAVSDRLREAGNLIFRQNSDNCEATFLYTKALFAAKTMQVAALAHANRAAALIHLGYFKEAYDDCKTALKLGYPTGKILKLIYRKAKCASAIQDWDKLSESIKEFEIFKERNQVKRETDEQFAAFKNQCNQPAVERKQPSEYEEKQVDKKQKLKFDKSSGRYIVAGENIQNECLITNEKAFAFVPVILHDENGENEVDFRCHNCASVDIIPFPCFECRRATYCSMECKFHHRDIHSLECEGYKKGLWGMIGIAHLAFRTLTTGLKHVRDHFTDPVQENLDPAEALYGNIEQTAKQIPAKYTDILNLVANLEKMPREDFLRFALTASMLCVYIENFTPFLKKSGETFLQSKFEVKLCISALLLKHIAQMVCNAHCIVQIVQNRHSDMKITLEKNSVKVGELHQFAKEQKTFAAIYPKISLYNHNCEPNIRNVYNQDILSVYATSNISVDEEIFNCYGIHYRLLNRSRRKMLLMEQYRFDCKCKHCTDLNDEEFEKFHSYVCSNCTKKFVPKDDQLFWWRSAASKPFLICSNCQSPYNCEWFYRLQELLNRQDPNFDLKLNFQKAIKIYFDMEQKLSKHHQLKQDIERVTLETFICLGSTKDGKEAASILLEVVISLLNGIEAQQGVHSTEYVLATTYLLDLLANFKIPVQYEFNFKKIPQSYTLLSNEMRNIFENYFEKHAKIYYLKL